MAKKQKIKGSYIHGVYVSAATKNEFKNNKQEFKEEGIKSAYSLQKQKNIATQARKISRAARRDVIKKAYELDKEKFSAIGYDVKFFLNQFQKIEEYNEKLRLAIKKGKILKDTPLLSFPISRDTGRINLRRLQKELKKLSNSISKIQKHQQFVFYHNVKEVYGKEIADIAQNALDGVPINDIYDTFSNDIHLSPLVNYDIEEFGENDRASLWGSIEKHQAHFLDLLEDLRRLV